MFLPARRTFVYARKKIARTQASGDVQRADKNRLPSFIQTLLSVPEFHRIMRGSLADCTAGREFHPALKTLSYIYIPLRHEIFHSIHVNFLLFRRCPERKIHAFLTAGRKMDSIIIMGYFWMEEGICENFWMKIFC